MGLLQIWKRSKKYLIFFFVLAFVLPYFFKMDYFQISTKYGPRTTWVNNLNRLFTQQQSDDNNQVNATYGFTPRSGSGLEFNVSSSTMVSTSDSNSDVVSVNELESTLQPYDPQLKPTAATSAITTSVESHSDIQERRNVVFVKTHKTASSTIQNIFYRYGLLRNLSFALPKNSHDFAYPGVFHKNSIAFPNSKPFNLMCSHIRFSYERVREVMPKDSLYISIVREPGQLFQSSFDYFYEIVSEFHRVSHRGNNSIETWLDNAASYTNTPRPSPFHALARNHMVFDLGYSEALENSSLIEKAIQEIDSRFDFIMISDYMDQSLVLLADLLRCALEDMASLKLNARARKNMDGEKSRRIREKVRLWNKADAALFDHFNRSLWERVEKYGTERMREDVEKLHKINENLMSHCVNGTETLPYEKLKNVPWKSIRIYQPKGVRITGYDLKPGAEKEDKCVYLIAPEPYLSSITFQAQKNKGKLKFKRAVLFQNKH